MSQVRSGRRRGDPGLDFGGGEDEEETGRLFEMPVLGRIDASSVGMARRQMGRAIRGPAFGAFLAGVGSPATRRPT